MNADVVIMDGMVLDAITSENKKLHKELALAKEMCHEAEVKSSLYAERIKELHKKMESKVAECVELAQKCCYYDKLTDELIKENNELHDQINKQADVEQSLWEKIWGLEHQIRFYDEDMEEFN